MLNIFGLKNSKIWNGKSKIASWPSLIRSNRYFKATIQNSNINVQ